MNKLRRVVGNTLISLFGQLVTWTSTLLLTIAYGRFLGDVKFGELYFAITFVSLLGIPIEVGFNQQLTRDVAEDPEKAHAYLWNTLLIKLILWVFLYAIVLFLSLRLGYGPEQRSIIVICTFTLLSGSIVSVFASLHYAFERTLYPAVGMILEKGLSAIVGFILLKNGATVQVMALVLLGGSLIDLIWQALWFFRLTGRHIVIRKKVLRNLVRGSIPFVVTGALGVIYYRIDTVLLSLMTNTAVVGWYGAGYRLFDTLVFIPNIIINAIMFPIFAKLSADFNSQSTFKMAIEKSMNLLVICAVPIAALFVIAAPNIVGFLYHRPEFANTVPVIQALAPGLVFLYINALFINIIVTTRGEKKIPILSATALVFNLALNLYLIPRYQQVGAAVVTSLTELLLLCISFFFVPKYLLPKKSMKVIVKVMMATLVMSLVALFMRRFSILFIIPIALLVYSGAALLFRTVPGEDIRALFSALGSKNKRVSQQVLTYIEDEGIYLQNTDLLPAVKRVIEAPGIPEVEACEPGATYDDDKITECQPIIRPGKVPRKVRLQLEKEVE
jgi:O-antigen/teichoic acid export membrane protein